MRAATPLLVLGVAAFWLMACDARAQQHVLPQAQTRAATPTPALQPAVPAVPAAAQPTLAPILARVLPSITAIAVKGRGPGPENPGEPSDPDQRRRFGLPETAPERNFQAAGSGVIVDAAKGLVVTNYHVIHNASDITIILNDGRSLHATEIGSDPEIDISVLKVEADGTLRGLEFGDSAALRVGDYVLAIGNPFGLRQTATIGIVSALARTGLGIEGYENFIQTDAPINPGNSGGALVDLDGRLVGINTAIVGPTGGSVGIGFAIPANMVRVVVDQLVATGIVRRGRIGVTVQDLTPGLAKVFGAPTVHGVVVTTVAPDSPAARAGIQVGDILQTLDGNPVVGSEDLRSRVSLMPAGRVLAVGALRDRRPVAASIEVAAALPQHLPAPVGSALEGAILQDIDGAAAAAIGARGVGVAEVRSESAAGRTGLRQGDVILAIGQVATPTLEAMIAALQQPKGHKGPRVVYIVRNAERLFLALD